MIDDRTRIIQVGLTPADISDILYEYHNRLIDTERGRLSIEGFRHYVRQVRLAIRLYPEIPDLIEHRRYVLEYLPMYKEELKVQRKLEECFGGK